MVARPKAPGLGAQTSPQCVDLARQPSPKYMDLQSAKST